MLSTFPTATISGYPYNGPNCEQTKAREDLWAGRIGAETFSHSMRSLRLNTYSRLRELGLDENYSIPASYTHYDHVLDTALSVGLVASEPTGTDFDVEEYFAAARGMGNQAPLVPELAGCSTQFRARPQYLLSLVSEARAAGHTIRPVLIGPVTLLALAKTSPGTSTSAFERLDELTTAYVDVISILAAAGVDWVQLDEPALTTDVDKHSDTELAEATSRAYATLSRANTRPQIFVTAPHGSLRGGLSALAHSGIDALGVDVSAATRAIDPDSIGRIAAETPASVHLVAGVIDSGSALADDLPTSLSVLQGLGRESLSASTSTSVPCIPHAVSAESDRPAAEAKVSEVKALATAMTKWTAGTARGSSRVSRPHGPLREVSDPQQLVAPHTVFGLGGQAMPVRLHKAGDGISVGSARISPSSIAVVTRARRSRSFFVSMVVMSPRAFRVAGTSDIAALVMRQPGCESGG
ncbi:hypothetical protein [Brevibacterium zhoupengii]|uniref:hypothetical protein n=1 Tax=Brevibacterium zhoupengii TaxID=2898795 RepID=UPI001E49BDFA|nr:hypothetical protein [Brevibacterium zhoupengii]